MKYVVKIQDKEWVFHYSPKDGVLKDDNDTPIDYDLQTLGNGNYSLILNGKSYVGQVEKTDQQYAVLLENQSFSVTIEDELRLLLKQFNKNQTTEVTETIVKAPIPGLVTQVLVKEGELVEKDTTLLTLEAMKMENIIKAPCHCKVLKILIKSGETVQQNQALIELEESE